jgi:hypothetical protein
MDINLDTSDWRLWVMCVIILGCLAFWLTAVFMAARNPVHRGSKTEIKGPVQGGRHIAAGGRSVSPNRDQLASETGILTSETGIPTDVPAGAVDATADPSQQTPSIPRPARDRDTSVPMPAQRTESPAENVQPISRP